MGLLNLFFTLIIKKIQHCYNWITKNAKHFVSSIAVTIFSRRLSTRSCGRIMCNNNSTTETVVPTYTVASEPKCSARVHRALPIIIARIVSRTHQPVLSCCGRDAR